MRILVTGGAGYIGSHTSVSLLLEGHDVVILDNLSNSRASVIPRITKLGETAPAFIRGDLRNLDSIRGVFDSYSFDAVIHFAGLKSVTESVSNPERYYDNNVTGSQNLLRVMQEHDVRTLVFSSSATVYGTAATSPIDESAETQPTNPYGRTKLFVEEILRDCSHADPRLSVSLLRYFNPVGAHSSGLIGEDPLGIPNNLVPYISRVAVGKLPVLHIFGDDYDTADGTGVRDYIHVSDLAAGHLAALRAHHGTPGVHLYNLGRGEGVSVREMLMAFEKAVGHQIPAKVTTRRPGDVGECFANPRRAEEQLGWKADRSIDEMAQDTWRWQSNNPDGYPEEPPPTSGD